MAPPAVGGLSVLVAVERGADEHEIELATMTRSCRYLMPVAVAGHGDLMGDLEDDTAECLW